MADSNHPAAQNPSASQNPSAGSSDSEEQRGKMDLVSLLYVVGGIPVMVVFIVGLFLLVGSCDGVNVKIPA